MRGSHLEIWMTGHISTAKGFEPLRAEPNGFLVHHLNHSVTLSMLTCAQLFLTHRKERARGGWRASPMEILPRIAESENGPDLRLRH